MAVDTEAINQTNIMSDNPEIVKQTIEEAWDKVTEPTAYETWWFMEGSVLTRNPGETDLEHSERLCAIAWARSAEVGNDSEE